MCCEKTCKAYYGIRENLKIKIWMKHIWSNSTIRQLNMEHFQSQTANCETKAQQRHPILDRLPFLLLIKKENWIWPDPSQTDLESNHHRAFMSNYLYTETLLLEKWSQEFTGKHLKIKFSNLLLQENKIKVKWIKNVMLAKSSARLCKQNLNTD